MRIHFLQLNEGFLGDLRAAGWEPREPRARIAYVVGEFSFCELG